MARAIDVAEYILQKQGSMTSMKLQRLLYYSHAWHLVWDNEPLFDEPIHAWANGPVVPAIYALHRGQFRVYPGMLYLNEHFRRIRLRITHDPQTRRWSHRLCNTFLVEHHQKHCEKDHPTAALAADAGRRCMIDTYHHQLDLICDDEQAI